MVQTLLLSFAICGLLAAAPRNSVKRLDGISLRPAEIDRNVTRLMEAAEVPGVGLAILNDGKPVYVKAYGLRDTDRRLPLTERSVLPGASLTKAAFSYLVMRLADDGRIVLDKPVVSYLSKPLAAYPSYTDLAEDPRAQRITTRMLLSHTSGFPNLRWEEPDQKLRIHFEPGSRYAYSGEGIQLLQLVVESILKKPVAEAMQERVFGPLGMTRTSMVSEKRVSEEATYDEWGRPVGVPERKTATAAGSMLTTLADFAKFMQAMAEGRGLKTSTRAEMLTPQIAIQSKHQFPTLDTQKTDANRSIRLSYGLGWGLYETPFGKAFFKEGHEAGARNYAVMFERSKIGMVILTNSANGEGIFKELIETLLGNVFTPIEWEGFTPYGSLPPRKPLPKHTEITLDAATLDRYVGSYAIAGLPVSVTREGNRLFYREGSDAKMELVAESERQFFSKSSTDSVRFDVDAQGRATHIVVLAGGREIAIQRSK
jgi:CubicO group peptidase (beta-lactamase class C family)